MKNSIILALLFTILIVSCAKNEKNYTVKEIDGIKVFHNKNIPSDPNFKITPKEVFTIKGYDENATDTLRNFIFPHAVSLDSKNNIYIMDGKLSEVKKFNPKGNFLKSIGRNGTGPGEIQSAYDMLVFNDTLYVVDKNTRLILSYKSDGTFIKNIKQDGDALLGSLTSVGKGEKIIAGVMDFEYNENDIFFSIELYFWNSQFEKTKTIIKPKKTEFIRGKTNFHDFSISFCVGKENIYIAKNSSNEYLVDVYNLNAEPVYRITKDFRKIKMPEEDVNTFQESRKAALSDNNKRNYEINYKKSIDMMSMYEDKNGYLLVQVPLERNKENEFDFVVDAFKDGIFINKFKMDIGKAFDFYNSDHKRWFIGNRIYYQNREDNCVTVYEY